MPRLNILLGIVTLATAAAVMAQEPQPPQPQPQPQQQPKAAPAAEKHISGEVASVNATEKTFTVRERATDPPEKAMTFVVDEQTKIARMEGSEKGLKLLDLKAGDRVMVKYSASAGKNIAESIEILKKEPTSN
jgi:Domain of unknown function (DUF5666)